MFGAWIAACWLSSIMESQSTRPIRSGSRLIPPLFMRILGHSRCATTRRLFTIRKCFCLEEVLWKDQIWTCIHLNSKERSTNGRWSNQSLWTMILTICQGQETSTRLWSIRTLCGYLAVSLSAKGQIKCSNILLKLTLGKKSNSEKEQGHAPELDTPQWCKRTRMETTCTSLPGNKAMKRNWTIYGNSIWQLFSGQKLKMMDLMILLQEVGILRAHIRANVWWCMVEFKK